MVRIPGMRFERKAAAILAILATGAMAAGTGVVKAPGWVVPSAVRGQVVYAKACAACHAEKGDALTPFAYVLNPRPRDFTVGTFKLRSTPNGELPTDQDLLRVVEEGIPGSHMPAWKGILTAQEMADVVAYVKTFAEDFKDGAPEPIVIPEPPESSPADIVEGRMVYMLMECWACHGGKGKGDGKSGKTLDDDFGRRIKPWNLTRYRYKAGNDPRTLYRTFTTGMNGTPMPAYVLDGFLIAGDVQVDPAKYSEAYKASDIEQLKEWLAGQPSEASLKKMSDPDKAELGERRKWALVHYIRSLVRKPGLFARIFVMDTEVTP